VLLQCKKESVEYYQSRLACLNTQNVPQTMQSDDRSSVQLTLHGEAVAVEVTPRRKRTQAANDVDFTKRKSARLVEKKTSKS